MAAGGPASSFKAAWPDCLAFVAGLALAWYAGWQTTDLIWSLWLSSLVVGYALIVWTVTLPLRALLRGQTEPVKGVVRGLDPPSPFWLAAASAKGATIAFVSVGTLFGLAFFTIHFGGFHFVHSALLQGFFPIDGTAVHGFPTWAMYGEVLRRYWVFLPLAFLAERSTFNRLGSATASAPVDVSVTAEAIARRKQRNATSGMMAPYVGVIRMHMLIFFFAFAHFAHLENFIVYAVVYAVYFFPWRLITRQSA